MNDLKGYVSAYGQPFVPIKIAGRREQVEINAIVDTGFDGDICLPVAIAVQLGLELKAVQEVEYVDGSIKGELVFRAQVELGERKQDAEVMLTEANEALIGTRLLMDSKLEIDFSKLTVEIKQ